MDASTEALRTDTSRPPGGERERERERTLTARGRWEAAAAIGVKKESSPGAANADDLKLTVTLSPRFKDCKIKNILVKKWEQFEVGDDLLVVEGDIV